MENENTQPQNSDESNGGYRPSESQHESDENDHEEKSDSSGQPAVAGDANNEKVMAILAYLGILVIVPILVAKDSEFVQYHANQGLVLFIAEIILFAIGIIPILGWLISFLGSLGVIVLAIMGILNAVNHKKEPLPLIGGYQILE